MAPVVWIHEAAAAGAGLGCAALLAAGWRERRGRLEAARSLARRGGFALAAATIVQTLFAPSLPWRGASPSLLATGVVAALAAAAAGLLGGLAGKPRPSGSIAAILWVLSLLARVAAARL